MRRFSTGTTLSQFLLYEWECKFLTQNVVNPALFGHTMTTCIFPSGMRTEIVT